MPDEQVEEHTSPREGGKATESGPAPPGPTTAPTGTSETVENAAAPRSRSEGQAHAVLNRGYELREIVIAQGIQFTNANFDAALAAQPDDAEYYKLLHVPQGLQPWFPKLQMQGTDRAEYVSDAQRVRFTMRVVNRKDEFKKALETEGLHVIYGGHARYGRGPCFGAKTDPGEDWEQGANPTQGGLLRLGFPIIGVHLSEVRQHGYSFWPVAVGGSPPAREDCHPEIQRGRLRAAPLPDDLKSKVLAQGQPLAAKYWMFGSGAEESILLNAGWDQSSSAPMDLGATKLSCRCFCHFGCSTYVHNWPIVRQRKGWTRTSDDRFAYFTQRPAYSLTVPVWLRGLFEYPRRNDYDSWFASLEWAARRTNQLLVALCPRYGLELYNVI